MVDRSNNKLQKVEFDMSRKDWIEFYGRMAKKPSYQVWVRPTKEEKALDEDAKGHWEKIASKS